MGGIIFLIIAFVVFIIILSVIRNVKAGARMMQGNRPMPHGGGGRNRGMNRRRVSYGGRSFYIYIGDDGYYYDESGYVIEDPEFGETDFIDDVDGGYDDDSDDGYDDSSVDDSSSDYGDNS